MNPVFPFKKSSIYALEGGLGVWKCHFVIITKGIVQKWTISLFSLHFWPGMIK